MKKVPSQIGPAQEAQWLEVLAEDDAPTAVEMMGMRTHPNPWGSSLVKSLVAEVLLANPLPTRVLDAIDAIEPRLLLNTGWVFDVEELAQPYHRSVDWKGVFDWHQKKYPKKSENELGQSFAAALVCFMEKEQRGLSSARLRGLLLDMLDLYPGLAREVDPKVVNPTYLFKLSTSKKSGDWLVRSGLDIEEVLYWGVRTGAAALPIDDVDSKALSLEAWLSLNLAHKEAWENLHAWDATLVKNHYDWIQEWIPKNVYDGSPLQGWVDRITNSPDSWADQGSPLDHLLFQTSPAPLFRENVVLAAKKYAMYFPDPKKQKEETIERSISINESILHDMNPRRRSLLSVGVSPLNLALSDSFSLADELMLRSDAAHLMGEAFKDKRMVKVASTWKLGDVLKWVTSNDYWRDWKSEDDLTFLEFYLQGKPKLGRVNKALITRLARQKPDWFTSDVDGSGLVASLNLDTETTAQVIRAALMSTAKMSKVKKSAFNPSTSKKPKM